MLEKQSKHTKAQCHQNLSNDRICQLYYYKYCNNVSTKYMLEINYDIAKERPK
jgi:hypothetical protein